MGQLDSSWILNLYSPTAGSSTVAVHTSPSVHFSRYGFAGFHEPKSAVPPTTPSFCP
jgi:hypothetical protein